jgi:Flp pilus assembly protein TadD
MRSSTNLLPVDSKFYELFFFYFTVALKNLDDPDNAHHAFEQAAKLDPNDAAVALNYGVLLNFVGEREKALVQLRRFQELAESGSGLDQEVWWKGY